jgi:cardiolipin synthase
VDRLKRGGASVRFCNPLGPSPIKLIRRNHKKIAVVDDRIVYLGGINFSDHNFAWHDMMLRVEDRDLASLIARDFGATWEGKSRSTDCSVGPLRLISLNGRSNAKRVGPILDSISSAQRSIDVVSAYLSHPFTHHLAEARRRGVRIRVLTPGKNNYPNLARHILQTAYEHDFEVYRYQGMSHLKAMLIDEELLITGSCNFDLMSYHLQEELIVMTRDRSLGNGFVERVWAPDFAVADRTLGRPTLGTLWGNGIVRLTAGLVGLMALT